MEHISWLLPIHELFPYTLSILTVQFHWSLKSCWLTFDVQSTFLVSLTFPFAFLSSTEESNIQNQTDKTKYRVYKGYSKCILHVNLSLCLSVEPTGNITRGSITLSMVFFLQTDSFQESMNNCVKWILSVSLGGLTWNREDWLSYEIPVTTNNFNSNLGSFSWACAKDSPWPNSSWNIYLI